MDDTAIDMTREDGHEAARRDPYNIPAPVLIALHTSPEFWDGWHGARSARHEDPTRRPGTYGPRIPRPGRVAGCPPTIYDLRIVDAAGARILRTAVLPDPVGGLTGTAAAIRTEIGLDYGDLPAGTLHLAAPTGVTARLPLQRTAARPAPGEGTLQVPYERPARRRAVTVTRRRANASAAPTLARARTTDKPMEVNDAVPAGNRFADVRADTLTNEEAETLLALGTDILERRLRALPDIFFHGESDSCGATINLRMPVNQDEKADVARPGREGVARPTWARGGGAAAPR